jgi:RHS repeat-associated protein
MTKWLVQSTPGPVESYDGVPKGGNIPQRDRFYDGRGDLAALTASNQTRVADWSYDAFGNPTPSASGNVTVDRFAGAWEKQLDPANDLVLMGARGYDPNLGRFLQVDPVDGGSANNYDYVNQDPMNQSDLTGMGGSPCGPAGRGGGDPAGARRACRVLRRQGDGTDRALAILGGMCATAAIVPVLNAIIAGPCVVIAGAGIARAYRKKK